MTRYLVWLDGLGLHDISPAIHITDVQEHAPEERITTAACASGDGSHVLHRARQSLSATIRFAVREQQPARRSAILQSVRAWALRGGSLTSSSRPGQRLSVVPGQLAALSTLRWTEELALTFTAYRTPWWEEDQPAQITAVQSPFFLPGDAPSAPMDLRWKCTSSATATLIITTPLSRITFCDVPVTAGQELLISHDAGVLTATLDGTDILPYRTPESSDDLLLSCGQHNAVSVTLNGVSIQDCTLTARGRWL